VKGNIVVDVSACNRGATAQAAQIAQKIQDASPTDNARQDQVEPYEAQSSR
jgi:hypothetical protein